MQHCLVLNEGQAATMTLFRVVALRQLLDIQVNCWMGRDRGLLDNAVIPLLVPRVSPELCMADFIPHQPLAQVLSGCFDSNDFEKRSFVLFA